MDCSEQVDNCDWWRRLPPCLLIPVHIPYYDVVSSLATDIYIQNKLTALRARRRPEQNDQSETRFMTICPDVVWINQSEPEPIVTSSSLSSNCSSGYGSDDRESTMSFHSEITPESQTNSQDELDPSYSLYMTEAPLVDNRIHYRTVGNQALADVLAQAHHLTDIDLQQPSSHWYNQGWRYTGTQKDVHILKRDTNRMNIYGIAGVTMIPKTPEYVYHIVRDPYYRFQYDKLLKTLTIVENVDHHTKVCHAHLEAKNCLLKQSREMVLVAADRMHNDSFATAVTSTEHPKCPLNPTLPRAELAVAGFFMTPHYQDGKLYTRIIYILQVDTKGLPSFVVDLVMKHQPLCVAYIRENIMTKKEATSMYLRSSSTSSSSSVVK